jgi:hypothetical protein
LKKKFKYFIKVVVAIILLAITTITIAYLWPTSTLQPPESFEKTIIKNVNIVDVVSGKVVRNQFVLIEHSRITKINSTQFKVSDDALIINGTDKFLIPGL